MRNGECGRRKAKKQLCVRLEVGGLRQKAKSPSNLLNLINPINSINYLRLEPIFFSIQHRVSSIQHRVSSIQHRVSSIEHRVSSIEYPVSSIEHRASSIQYRVSTPRKCGRFRPDRWALSALAWRVDIRAGEKIF